MVSFGKVLERGKDSSSLRGPDLKLFVRDVRDRQGRKRAVTVRSWSTIQDVKHIIQKVLSVPPSSQKLYFGPLLSSGGELPNHRTLHDAGIYRSGEVLLLDIKEASTPSAVGGLRGPGCNDLCISSSMIDSCPRALRSLVQRARRGFLLGLKPEFVMDGSSGTYFLHDAKKVKIAVFKPADEEPYAENNPCGYLPQPGQALTLREGVAPGEACIREVAAYLLDHDGFSGVPMTTLTEARHPAFNTNGARLSVAAGGASIGSHSICSGTSTSQAGMKKVGSFQEFAHCECTMDDISPSKISVDEVHKIAILDIRIMNADRNSANLLVRRNLDNSLELVPIDHGFCLRSVSDVSWMDWCWLDWPQLKKPMSEETKKYVRDLDIEADARMLHEQLNINSDAIDYFRASSRILKAGVQAGLSLYEIAIMCCRNDNMGEIPSKLEILFSMASDLSLSALENGRWHHSAASRALAEQLSPRGGPLIPSRHHSMVGLSRMSKSTSAVHFKMSDFEDEAVISNLNGTLDDVLKKDYPGMVQSSASDSSSETGDGPVEKEEEECDEWAAALLNNISLDRSMSIIEKERSPSIGSEDDSSSDADLSSSPKGFWFIRPGSPSAREDDDEDAWNESPEPSPIKPVTFAATRPSQVNFLAFPETPLSTGLGEKQHFRTPTVTFADEPWREEELELPRSEHGYEQHVAFPDIPKLPSGGGMTRSQSYSALNTTAREGRKDEEQGHQAPNPGTKEYEQFRDYFLKFIELVIVRETKAATYMSQISDVST